MYTPFHGTFAPSDVTVLLQPHVKSALTPGALAPLGSVKREISQELPFDADYMRLYEHSLLANKHRVALDAVKVARALAELHDGDLVLVSLMRAGTVAGVLVQRALTLLGCQSKHYASNVVQGLRCQETLDYIVANHDQSKVVFIDGWTGKGSVATQLKSFVSDYNASHGTCLKSDLVVLSDPGGVAALSAGGDEYMLPHALLRVTGSGLFSGAIIDADESKLGQFDACIFYDNLFAHDVTQVQNDAIEAAMYGCLNSQAASWTDADRAPLRQVGLSFIEESRRLYGAQARVRPGLCEAARALVKTYPSMVLRVRDDSDSEVQALKHLAASKLIPIHVHQDLPYRAAVMVLKTK